MSPSNGDFDLEQNRDDRRTAASAATQTRATFFRILRLSRKELRESLRDRRTLMTLILMPLIVYPLLGSVVQKFAINRFNPDSLPAIVVFDSRVPEEYASAVVNDAEPDIHKRTQPKSAGQNSSDIGASNQPAKTVQELATSLTGDAAGAAIGAMADGENPTGPPMRFRAYESPIKADYAEDFLQQGEADIAVRMVLNSPDPSTGQIAPVDFQIISRSGDPFSQRAAVEVEKRLLAFRDRELRKLLDQTRFGSGVLPTISQQSIANDGPKSSPLGAFLPLMLVLMTMTGAVYPAIDLTAGERERGTLEILMAAPVSRAHLLTGKFIAVLTVAVLTAVINLVAMLLTLYATGFDRVLLADGATLEMFISVLILLIVFASFFSAVLLSITSFARSFREAQAWLIPLMLVSLAPGILSLMPGVDLTLGLAVVPLVNIVLLGRELFQGTAAIHLYAVTLFSTLAYTILALRVAANVFGHDTVLFGSSGGISRRETHGSIPFSVGIGWLVLLIPLFLVLSGVRGQIVSINNLSGQLILSGFVTILLFAVVPVAITWWIRASAIEVFAVRKFHFATLLGAVMLGCTMWTLAYEMLVFSKGSPKWLEMLNNSAFKELARRLTETPLFIRVTTLALIPAVCEEIFFRGFLLNTLQKQASHWLRPMLFSTFVFAAFHVIVDPSLPLERFPATFMLGLVLCGIRISSGSIFPGIVMHAISNGLLLSLKELEPVLQFIGLNLNVENESSLPTWFLVSSILISCAGAGLVWLGRKRP